MGNSQPLASVQTFPLYGTIEHPHLGSIKSTQQHEDFLKVYHFSDHMMGEEKLRRINARIKKFPNSNFLLNFRKAELVTKQDMCANTSDLFLYFQRYSQSLSTVLVNRIKEKKNFQEKQVYEFLHHVLQALIFLQDNGFKNCHLDKQSIVMSQNKIKVLDLAIATNNPFQTYLDNLEPIPGFYVAPEMLKQLKQKNYEPYISPKSDVFCLGMLTLQLCCMEQLDNYYDLHQYSIDYESLIHRVSRIGYTTELKTLLAGMLEYESDLRLGLISCQEQVKKIMKVDSLQSSRNKENIRSRSSSTKMLKDLLTNSRRTIKSSSQTQNSFSNRKPSLASLTSNESIQNTKEKKEKQMQKSRKYSQIYPSGDEANLLKNLVKSKTSLTKEINKSIDQSHNKENHYISNRMMMLNQRPSQNRINISKASYMRAQTEIARSFFDISETDRFRKKTDMITPKEKYLRRIDKPKKEQSIFKMIEDNSNFHQSQDSTNVNQKVPLHSPVVPQISLVQVKGAFEKKVAHLHQVANFTTEAKLIENFNDEKQKQLPFNNKFEQKPITLKIKKSLGNMYKTTQSITNSQQKSIKKPPNQYKKVVLSNNYFYEGEVNQNGQFEGNGFLHNQKGEVIYSGSWVCGQYEGFGTLHNLNVTHKQVNMNNLNECPKNWVKYEGQFSKGEWEGFGTIYYSGGERISGCMRNGKINGYGCFYDSCNQMTSGIWVNNKFQNS